MGSSSVRYVVAFASLKVMTDTLREDSLCRDGWINVKPYTIIEEIVSIQHSKQDSFSDFIVRSMTNDSDKSVSRHSEHTKYGQRNDQNIVNKHKNEPNR